MAAFQIQSTSRLEKAGSHLCWAADVVTPPYWLTSPSGKDELFTALAGPAGEL